MSALPSSDPKPVDPIKIQFSENQTAANIPKSKGNKTNRIKFVGIDDQNQRYAAAIASKLIKQKNPQDNPPRLNILERRRFVLLKVKDENNSEIGYVKVNANSLSKRFGVKKDTLMASAQQNAGDASKIIAKKLLEVQESEAEVKKGLDLLKEDPADFGKKAYDHFFSAAEKGNSEGLNQLGLCWLKGVGTSPNASVAVSMFKKAAELGNADAMYNLGYCYANRLGLDDVDLKEALKLYEKSAEAGSSKAMNALGEHYQDPRNVQRDVGKAFEWFKKGAEKGNAAAMYNLAKFHEFGTRADFLKNPNMNVRSSFIRYEKAFEWYEKAALKGHEEAVKKLVAFYAEGKGVVPSKKTDEIKDTDEVSLKEAKQATTEGLADKAFKEWQKIANIPAAMNALGECYLHGKGTTKNPLIAKECFENAADRGDTDAMVNLALVLPKVIINPRTGNSIPSGEALAWLEKAAEKKNIRAMYELGVQYLEYLQSAPKDAPNADISAEKALEYLNKSAEGGYAPAMYKLCQCYKLGEQTEKDFKQAKDWLEKAVAQDYPDAIVELGLWYFDGSFGTPKDLGQAKELFSKAANAGHEKAAEYLKSLQKG